MIAETLITPNSHPDESSDPPALPSVESLFSRKVDFSGFSNGSGGFRLETLNPTTISDPRWLGASGQGSGQSGLSGRKPDGLEFLDVGLDPELSLGLLFRELVQDWKSWKYLFSQFSYTMPHIYRAFSLIFTKWEASKFLVGLENFSNTPLAIGFGLLEI